MEKLWMLPRGAHKALELPSPGSDASISHLLFSRRGELWLAKDGQGIYRFPSGDPRASAPLRVLPAETVTALFEDSDGAIWIGGEQGLWKTGKNGAGGLELIDPLARKATAISRDSRGRIWVASAAARITIYSGGARQLFRYENLPAPEVYGILEDGAGGMWFSTGRGLARASMLDVDKSLQSPGNVVSLFPYGVAEGMRTIECRCARQPQSWKMADGTLWVPTAKGFIQIDPSRGERNNPPQPVIEAITLDGKTIPADQAIDIPPGRHELQARFTAIRLGLAEGVRFRYRMEGLEPEWVRAGSVRLARYGQLPPGRFRFAVSARDADGAWSAPVSVGIAQRPEIYQTLWFRTLLMYYVRE
jgi:ligand-binding sensor domain-containing protein